MTLSLDTAYRSFGGEVEASSTPTICRLPDSRRHQLSAIAPGFAVALLCLVSWLLRLSILMRLISDSILVGFKAGAGLTIILT